MPSTPAAWRLQAAVEALACEGVIATPTEAVWGLSCDPDNSAAVEATEAAQISFGGFGYAKEYHVERLVREALLFRIVPVTPQMLLSFIAEKALGLPKSY